MNWDQIAGKWKQAKGQAQQIADDFIFTPGRDGRASQFETSRGNKNDEA